MPGGHDNAAILRDYYDVWDRGASAEIGRFLAEGFVGHDPSLGVDYDREGLKGNIDALSTALPGYSVAVESVVVQDDHVVVRWRTDHEKVSFTGMTMYRLRDGLIEELWNEWDNQRFIAALSG